MDSSPEDNHYLSWTTHSAVYYYGPQSMCHNGASLYVRHQIHTDTHQQKNTHTGIERERERQYKHIRNTVSETRFSCPMDVWIIYLLIRIMSLQSKYCCPYWSIFWQYVRFVRNAIKNRWLLITFYTQRNHSICGATSTITGLNLKLLLEKCNVSLYLGR